MSSARKQAVPAQETLRRSEERFELLVRSVRDYAIVTMDPDGRIVSWNEGAERLKGYPASEILGRSFAVFYPQDAIDQGLPQYGLECAIRDGHFEDEGWRVRKDGSRFWAHVVITALRDPGGELLGFAKVTRELTERREADEQGRRLAAERVAHAEAAARSAELERLNERLELQAIELKAATEAAREAYRDLDQFAYIASHDLKAPLRGIANLAQWLQDDLGEALADESRKHLRLLQSRVERMDALIDGILTYSRAGRRLTPPEPVDVGALVRDVIELLAPAPGIAIRLPDRFPTVIAERVPLQQVFLNLLGNAIKHTRGARPDPVIEVAWHEAGDDFRFEIRDNGPGIAPEYHERIWSIFQTLPSRDKLEGGTGIGLALVKKIVESRGGAVFLDSAPGQGATFRFTWPKVLKRSFSP